MAAERILTEIVMPSEVLPLSSDGIPDQFADLEDGIVES